MLEELPTAKHCAREIPTAKHCAREIPTAGSTMRRSKRSHRAPKSPTAVDRRAPASGEGPRNRAPSNQAQPQQQPQRQVRFSASSAPALQLAAPGPAAWPPASASHHGAGRRSRPLSSPQTPRIQAAAATTSSTSPSWSLQHGFCPTSTPSRARARSPSPPPGSRSSSASSAPSHISLDSGGSVRPTYADIVARGSANQNCFANHSSLLLEFLKAGINIKAERTASDMNQIISLMPVAGTFDLVFSFQRLLEFNKELAYAICSSQDRFNEWVYPTVSQFIIGIGITKDVAERIKVTFSEMPDSIKPLKDFIREQPLAGNKSIFCGNFQLCIANDIGMMLLYGFLVEIYNRHLQDLTWNGGFSLSDMVVVNSTQCIITKKPMRDESHCIAEDLHRLEDILMPMFSCRGEMALYFDVLKQDLKGANKNLVKEEWFWEYLLAHPALKQPLARFHLECGLKQAAEIFGGQGTPLQSVLGGHSDWKALIPAKLTENTLATDVILYKAFWFKREPTECVEDPFKATVGGLLKYKRNLLGHGEDYVKVDMLSELELFAAKSFPQALPTFLRSLLRDCKIHMGGPLNELWQVYHPPRVGRWQW